MKRLFFVFALATLVAMSLVSCKPNEVKLHADVGTVYGNPTETMGGDGIVFFVDEGAGYALVCSMNDVRRDRQTNTSASAAHLWEKDFTWSVFGTDTVMEKDTVWAKVSRKFRYFAGKESTVSVPENSLVNEPETFVKYNYEERDSIVTIYPMLRYKAYTEKGVQVLPPFTKDTAFIGFIGEWIEADTVLASVEVEKIIGDTTWNADTVSVNGQKYALALNGKFENGNMTLYRPFNDTVERRTRTYSFLSAGYSDTLWNRVKRGQNADVMQMENNKGLFELDTNWSFSLIPGLGEDDPDGRANTKKIVEADVPCRQKVTPDSSSAARSCREYFTRDYVSRKADFAKDTALKETKGQWFLPSRAELRHLFDARNKINGMHTGVTKGFEALQDCYWSSNQRDAGNAWYKCFSDNGVESYIPKANNNYRVNIRAVRRVDWPLK